MTASPGQGTPTPRGLANELGCEPHEVMAEIGRLLREGGLSDVVNHVHFLEWCDQQWDVDPAGVRAAIRAEAAKLRRQTMETIRDER